jgi:hypothetical protein
MHARFVLQWLAGGLDALPLWNGGPGGPYVTDGVESPRSAALMDDVHSWAMLAELRHPWLRDDSADGRASSGAARGVVELMDWVCGETLSGPVTGERTPGFGRPSLYQVAVEVQSAMGRLVAAREKGDEVTAGRMEAVMDTFVWLAGWSEMPPVDRHGDLLSEECGERMTECGCAEAGTCLRAACPACGRIPCVEGFYEDMLA